MVVLTKRQQLGYCGILLTAVQRRTVGASESWGLKRRTLHQKRMWMICNLILIDAYNFPKTPLELHKGLALVVDASFAVLTSQRKLIVHWKETGIKHNSLRNLFFYTPLSRRKQKQPTYKRSCAHRRHKTLASCSSGPWTCEVCRWQV